MQSATAIAHPNIALIKYWGDHDPSIHLPSNSSLSMTLAGLYSRTTVSLAVDQWADQMTLNGKPAKAFTLDRVRAFLDLFRKQYSREDHFFIESSNNFPSGAGIASSASAFAALSLAVTSVCQIQLDEKDLSRLARLGSGSACRSIAGGFVEWQAGIDHETSYAYSIAPPSHWALVDCIAIASQEAKQTSSLQGHALADTSPLQAARIAHTPQRLEVCRQAILERDFDLLAQTIECDSHMMHAVMMTSSPPLLYWLPATVAIMQAVNDWRKNGLPVCYTIDAGANVHVLCEAINQERISGLLSEIPGVRQVITAQPGGSAYLENNK